MFEIKEILLTYHRHWLLNQLLKQFYVCLWRVTVVRGSLQSLVQAKRGEKYERCEKSQKEFYNWYQCKISLLTEFNVQSFSQCSDSPLV